MSANCKASPPASSRRSAPCSRRSFRTTLRHGAASPRPRRSPRESCPRLPAVRPSPSMEGFSTARLALESASRIASTYRCPLCSMAATPMRAAMATSVGSVGPLSFEGEASVRCSRLLVAALGFLPLPALAQQQQAQPPVQQSTEWSKLPRMQLERQFSGPLQDTLIQRWNGPAGGTIFYIYLTITAAHSPPTASGYVQYGPNTIGSMSCFAAPRAGGPSATTSRPSAGTPPRTSPSPAVPSAARPPAAPAAPTQARQLSRRGSAFGEH